MLERIVYSLFCIFFLYYIARKYLKNRNYIYLGILALQMIATVVQVLSVAMNETMDPFLQAYILFFALAVPICDFCFDYIQFDIAEFFYIKFGDYYFKRSLFDEALEKYKLALSRKPKSASTFAKLGKVYNALNDRRTAFDRFAKAVELDKNDYESYYEIGVIFNDIGKKDDAKIVLDNALRIKPDFSEASELLAIVLCALGKYDEAIKVYKDALKYEPNNYQLYYSMGIVRTELRDYLEAKECYEQAVSLNPNLYDAYFSLGQIHLLMGELLDAETMFKRALYDKKLTAQSYYQLAKVYILNDEEIKAVTYIEYAIEIDSSYRYKADQEPLFDNIKDYLKGLHMVSQVQMELEKELNKQATFKENVSDSFDDSQFDFLDKFS